MACLSTKTPSFNAFLCLLVVIAVWVKIRHLAPRHFLPAITRANRCAWSYLTKKADGARNTPPHRKKGDSNAEVEMKTSTEISICDITTKPSPTLRCG